MWWVQLPEGITKYVVIGFLFDIALQKLCLVF